MKLQLLIATSFLFFMSCTTTKKVSELTEADIEFTLKKGSCFGECPVYTFDIYEGGYAIFKGRRFTTKLGKYSTQVPAEKYSAIKKAFKSSNFSEFDAVYKSGIPDLPSVTITYRDKENLMTVKGKRERPTKLHRLQFLLEEIAESVDGWVFIEDIPEEVSNKPKYIKSQIILHPREGLQLPKWFGDKREKYGMRILKKLIEGDNLWLISFDTNKMDPDEMLKILQADPDVITAEFNKEVSPR